VSSFEVDRAPSRSQTFKDVRSGQRASEPHAPNALTGRLGVIPTGSFAAKISGQRMSLLRRQQPAALAERRSASCAQPPPGAEADPRGPLQLDLRAIQARRCGQQDCR